MHKLNKSFIGPHNIDILSILYGTLLGDSHIEKRSDNIRFSFQQENRNVEYLFWLWSRLSEAKYCTDIKPKLRKCLGQGGKVRFYYKFNTYTFTNLNYMYYDFHKNNSSFKRVPDNIYIYLTPLALACWIMDDGTRVGAGIKISTNSFIKEDVMLLINVLLLKWGINASIQKCGKKDQWVIYIPKAFIPLVQDLVRDFIVPSMLYKIHL